jgi:hypothetical protein
MARQQKPESTEIAVADTPKKSQFDRVAGYLDAQDWTYTANQENSYFTTSCRIKDASVRVVLDVFEADDWCRILAYSTFPVYVPEQKRALVVEALTRINYSMIYGNLEMDLKDGEIRVRTVVEGETQLSDGMIERVLNSNLNTADRHFGAIMAVVFGNAAPDTVVELASRSAEATIQ